jgi:glycerol-3-phosphate dehydrogenase
MKEEVPQLAKRFNVAPETVGHLVHFYGARAEKVLQLAHDDPRLAEAVSPESRDIYAQVLYGIREEGAKTISDVVLRRMHLGITSSRGGQQAERIAETAGRELGWSNDEKKHWVERFADDLAREKMF